MKNLILLMTMLFSLNAFSKTTYNIAWSIYVGWMPWEYAETSGILKKWADKYDIDIKLTKVNDYIESVSAYTAGKFDGCTMTNIDALTIPAVGGKDSTALIVGDFSNGNDGIIVRNGTSVKDLKGKDVMLVQLSVSHYLLTRALSMHNMQEKDLNLINTSDADLGALFAATKDANMVTWNPILMNAKDVKGANVIFDSSKTPGEIIDLMIVRSDAPDNLKKALIGAWFETMSVMGNETHPKNKDAISFMAKQSGSTLKDFQEQLKSTAMFYNASDAVKFSESNTIKNTMDYVRTFSYKKGLYGDSAKNKDFVGIQFPDGTVMGNSSNIKLRFDSNYMKQAAKNNL